MSRRYAKEISILVITFVIFIILSIKLNVADKGSFFSHAHQGHSSLHIPSVYYPKYRLQTRLRLHFALRRALHAPSAFRLYRRPRLDPDTNCWSIGYRLLSFASDFQSSRRGDYHRRPTARVIALRDLNPIPRSPARPIC